MLEGIKGGSRELRVWAGPFGPNRAVKVVTEANGRVNPLVVGCLQHSRHNVEYLQTGIT